jgi:UDP-3-O-[3-hydroxymyristoyl] glucosamine N-acyltransferase
MKTIAELVANLGGELKSPSAGAERRITRLSTAADAGADSLLFVENEAAFAAALASQAGLIALSPVFSQNLPGDRAFVIVDHPKLWFAKAGHLLRPKAFKPGIHPLALVDAAAQVSPLAAVEAFASIAAGATVGDGTRIATGAVVGENCRIGRDCTLYPRVVLYPDTVLGDRVILHAGAVLGADGFGYVRDRASGAYTQFPQHGRLVVEDDVEVGANTTIDRAALEETRIGKGTKLDNLVHIGHNCHIGQQVAISAQTGISGSCKVGDGAILGGQVGVGDHAEIGPGVMIGGQAGILSQKKEKNNSTPLWGTPAKPLKEYLRELATLARLAKRSKPE